VRPDDGIVVDVFEKPSAAMMLALRDFVVRHEIFVEAREFRGAAQSEVVRVATSRCSFEGTNAASSSSA